MAVHCVSFLSYHGNKLLIFIACFSQATLQQSHIVHDQVCWSVLVDNFLGPCSHCKLYTGVCMVALIWFLIESFPAYYFL